MSEKVTNGSAVAAPKQKKSFAELYSKYGTFAILAAVLVIGTIASPKFMTLDNMINVLRQNSYLLIIAFGTTFVMVMGCINIAYDMMLALVGCASCLVYVNTGGNMLLTIGISLVLGGILGMVYGALVTYFNLPPFIVGLAISSFCQGMTLLITGGRSIPGTMGTSYTFIGQGEVFGIPVALIIMFACMAITWVILRKMVFGRHAIAVGGNRQAAIASGIRAKRVIRIVYIMDGVLLGLAALVFMSRLGVGQPNPGTGYGFDAITGVNIGGASLSGGSGGAVGSFIGMIIVGLLNNIMNLLGLSSAWQFLIKGLLIVFAVIVDMKTKEALVKTSTAKQ